MSNFILFPEPYNFGGNRTNRRAVVDKNLNTAYAGTDVTPIISENGQSTGNARRASHIFTISETATAYTVASQTVMLPITKTVDRHNISTVFEGKTYILHELETVLTQASLSFTFSPSGKIYRLAVLDDTNAFNRDNSYLFDVIDIDRINLGRVHSAADGTVSDSPPLNNMSQKWRIRLRAKFYGEKNPDTLVESLLSFFGQNRHFFACIDTDFTPYLCFPALLENRETQIRYLSNKLGRGRSRSVSLTIRER